MTITFLLLAALVLVYILRAEGDETIGFGAAFQINDGVADAFQTVPKVVSLGVASYTLGTVESKRLDLTAATIKKLATLHNGNNFTVQIQATAAIIARLKALREARAEKQFKWIVPLDTGNLEIVVPGIVTAHPIEEIESEKINVVNLTVEVSGAQVS